MHELPVTDSLLEIALRHAEQAGAKRVVSLNIVIGRLASIVDDSVQFYWDIVSENTIAAGARLNFVRTEIELECQKCGCHYQPAPEELSCPECQSTDIKVVSGQEFHLESIDVE